MDSLLIEHSLCTGCEACVNSCSYHAISMVVEKDGFRYPKINKKLCKNCKKCSVVCKSRTAYFNESFEKKIYAAWSINKQTRFYSTSGGVFPEIANNMLKENGYIVGAEYVNPYTIAHTIISKKSDLFRIQQSKYAQSSINSIYKETEELLQKNVKVLFCGTPCQIAGLKSFLAKDHSNLYTVDFICRGVNSPIAYKYWLKELELQHGSKISQVWFKYKDKGWKSSPRTTKITFNDKSSVILRQKDNLFISGYLDLNLYIRKSCSMCQFKYPNTISDITLGDFWGVDEKYDSNKGTSIVIVNSKKGKDLFNNTTNIKKYKETIKLSSMANSCYTTSIKINNNNIKAIQQMHSKAFSRVIKKYAIYNYLYKRFLNK